MVRAASLNGLDVNLLSETITLIKDNPHIAQFKFRATNKWIDGTHNRALVYDFYGAGEVDTSREPMEFDMGEPPVLLGKNEGANPVEYLLVALSGCLTTSLVAHAAAQGIALRGLESRVEGDLDLRGFLGISTEVPVGFQEIRVTFKIDADLSEEKKGELIRTAQAHSPVFNSLAYPLPVSVQLEK